MLTFTTASKLPRFFSLAVGAGLILSLTIGGALAAPRVGLGASVLRCHTIIETQCTADATGKVSGCHDVSVYECVVVAGPGSGKVAQ